MHYKHISVLRAAVLRTSIIVNRTRRASNDTRNETIKALDWLCLDHHWMSERWPLGTFHIIAYEFITGEQGEGRMETAQVLFGRSSSDLLDTLDAIGLDGLKEFVRSEEDRLLRYPWRQAREVPNTTIEHEKQIESMAMWIGGAIGSLIGFGAGLCVMAAMWLYG